MNEGAGAGNRQPGARGARHRRAAQGTWPGLTSSCSCVSKPARLVLGIQKKKSSRFSVLLVLA